MVSLTENETRIRTQHLEKEQKKKKKEEKTEM